MNTEDDTYKQLIPLISDFQSVIQPEPTTFLQYFYFAINILLGRYEVDHNTCPGCPDDMNTDNDDDQYRQLIPLIFEKEAI